MKLISRILIPALFLFAFSQNSRATDRYWVGPLNGAYSNANNWNTASDGSGAPGVPTSSDNIIIDQDATILIDGNYSPASLHIMDFVVVEFNAGTGRTLTIGGGTVSPAFVIDGGSELDITGSVTIAMAIGAQCEIYGILDFSGSNSKMDHTAGVTTIKSGGTIRYGGTSANGIGSLTSLVLEELSMYEIYKNAGIFPTGTYDPNSLVYNSGATTTIATFAMNSATGSYGNYEFDCPSFTSSSSAINMNVTFNDFFLFSTNTGRWIFSTSTTTPYTMTINHDLNVGSDAVFDINKATSGSQATMVLVKNDIGIDGVVTETGNNTGSVLEISGDADSYFYEVEGGIVNDVDVTVNKSAGTYLYAFADIFLSDNTNAKLNLVSGVLDMASYNTTLIVQNPNTGAIVGGSIASHIIGPVKRYSNQIGSYSFPVSDNIDQMATAVIATTTADPTSWTVQFFAPNPNDSVGLSPGVINQVTDYYWDIFRESNDPNDPSTFSEASNLTLHYGNLTDANIQTPSQLKVVYYDGFAWQDMGGVQSVGAVTNSLGTDGFPAPGDPITQFGNFALGGTTNTLPLKIEYITGRRAGKTDEISWKINCNSVPAVNMVLQRSNDARSFTDIYSLAADAARCQQAFEYTDANPLPGKNFYRVAVQDVDGQYIYSRIIVLADEGGNLAINSVYPNPASGSFITADVNSNVSGTAVIQITDNLGRKVQTMNSALVPGLNKINLDISGLPQGKYQMTVLGTDGTRKVIPFVRTR